MWMSIDELKSKQRTGEICIGYVVDTLYDAVAELQAKNDKLSKQVEEQALQVRQWQELHERHCDDETVLRKRIEILEQNFIDYADRYGDHWSDCMVRTGKHHCTCGHDQALEVSGGL